MLMHLTQSSALEDPRSLCMWTTGTSLMHECEQQRWSRLGLLEMQVCLYPIEFRERDVAFVNESLPKYLAGIYL